MGEGSTLEDSFAVWSQDDTGERQALLSALAKVRGYA